jgi:hypothetical protein
MNTYTYTKALPYLNLREQPNTNSFIIDKIYPYTPINMSIENIDNYYWSVFPEWSKIIYNDKLGYIKSNYLADDNEVFLYNYALQNNLDYLLLLAILLVESRNKGFKNGNLVLRFELHIFKNYFVKGIKNKEIFAQHFNIYNQYHYFNYNNTWIEYHHNNLEKEAFELAKTLNEEYALLSTSYGVCQLMGYNHDSVGFDNVFKLYNYMLKSELNHYKVFISFLENRNIIHYIKEYNFDRIAELYNGTSNIKIYSELIKNKYKELKYGK